MIASTFRWLDRRPYLIPLIAAAVSIAAMAVTYWLIGEPILLASAKPAVRQQFYSSLTSSSGSLLGFTIAAVTILAAFGPKKTALTEKARQESVLARARMLVSNTLLITAFLLLCVLLFSTILLAIDQADVGNIWLMLIDLGAGFGAATGLMVGGLGLALAVAERSRE